MLAAVASTAGVDRQQPVQVLKALVKTPWSLSELGHDGLVRAANYLLVRDVQFKSELPYPWSHV